MKKMSVKEVKNVVMDVVKGVNEKSWVWIDYYKVKGGKKVRMKWWGKLVSDEEIEELKKRLGSKFEVDRNKGIGGLRGWFRKGNDLVIRVMWEDLRFRKYVMKS